MADYEYVTSTGVIVPDTSDILTQVETEWQDTLAPDLNTAPSTPQGVLIVGETLARTEVVGNNAAVANQINPNIAGGVFLEAICALTGFDVPSATFSTIEGVTLTGVAGSSIAAGSLASQTANPDVPPFALITTTIIPVGGTIAADFQCTEAGTVPCEAAALDKVVSVVLGWETVSNANAAVLGVDQLSDAQIRTLRNNTLGAYSEALPEAITSALYLTDGVRSLQFRENIADSTQTIDGISMVAHSIWACVQGGTDQDVAAALMVKTLGANWNGDVSVTYVDPSSGQSYTVLFDRPTDTAMFVRITAPALSSLQDQETSMIDAVVAYAAGEVDGQPGFIVGAGASPFTIAGAVMQQIPGLFVTKCEVSLDGTSYVTTEITAALNIAYETVASQVAVVIT